MSPVWCQPCAAGLGGGLGVLVVARHHQRAAHADLAALAARQLAAVARPGSPRAPAARAGRRTTAARRAPAAVGVEVVGRRHHRDHHRRLGLAEQLRHHRADPVQRLLEPGRRHRRGAVPEALQRARGPSRRAPSCAEHHVDQRRRQERVGDPVPLDQREEPADVGRAHDHDLAAERQDREAQHAGGVGQRREREVDRAARRTGSPSGSAPSSSRGWRR